jgi:cytochrome o ubiquinol oxidase subunit 1
VPTGVKVFNWLFTMYGGRVRFSASIHWAIGFMITFIIGGMTGVLMASPPVNFVLHNSLFLVAHFHNVIIGGVVFGAFAGYTYWFPKAFGFTLDERLGKASFWCWFVGFYLAFMPLYALGLMGATRRMQHYPETGWQPLMLVAFAGSVVILAGIVLTILQLVVSIRTREARRDVTGDPWDGRTLEWSTTSPPPAWNFAVLPQVDEPDAFWAMKRASALRVATPRLEPIETPKNSPLGFLIAFFATVMGFALIWHIWWMAIAGVAGLFAAILAHGWRESGEVEVSVAALAAAGARHGPEVSL